MPRISIGCSHITPTGSSKTKTVTSSARAIADLANKGAYWPDPGSPGWQDYFADKVLKLIRETGGQWNGVLLDQFMGTADGYERYAGAHKQIKYADDEAFQAAQIKFLQVVAAKIRLPIIVNMEGASIIRRPAFVGEVARAAGGAENEIFPEEMPIEDLRPYLETVQNLPPQCPHPHQFKAWRLGREYRQNAVRVLLLSLDRGPKTRGVLDLQGGLVRHSALLVSGIRSRPGPVAGEHPIRRDDLEPGI